MATQIEKLDVLLHYHGAEASRARNGYDNSRTPIYRAKYQMDVDFHEAALRQLGTAHNAIRDSK